MMNLILFWYWHDPVLMPSSGPHNPFKSPSFPHIFSRIDPTLLSHWSWKDSLIYTSIKNENFFSLITSPLTIVYFIKSLRQTPSDFLMESFQNTLGVTHWLWFKLIISKKYYFLLIFKYFLFSIKDLWKCKIFPGWECYQKHQVKAP